MAGLCGVATTSTIDAQGWSLNPGRYVHGRGVTIDDVDLTSTVERLLGEFERLDGEARFLGERITSNMARILEGGHSDDGVA